MREYLPNRIWRWSIVAVAMAGLIFVAAQASSQNAQNRRVSGTPASAKTADDLTPSSPQVIQPGELAQAMKAAQKPVVLYVGPKAFYAQAHIPGAEYIGPAARPEGMEKLQAREASLPKDGAVVIYCGCCPWDHCPNIRPAYAALKKAGFSKVRVLYLPTSFGVDWKDKGLPVATGE